MLVEFRVQNFRSLRDEAVLSFEATHLVAKSPEVDAATTFVAPDGRRLLRSAMILGANASGKSSVVRALSAFETAILASATEARVLRLVGQAFRLDAGTATRPTRMEAVFYAGGHEHRYGFEALGDQVVAEWLYDRPRKHERALFRRTGAEVHLHRAWEDARIVVPRTPPTALFLSTCAHFQVERARAAQLAIASPSVAFGLGGTGLQTTLSALWSHRPVVSGLVLAADTGIRAFRFRAKDGTLATPATLPGLSDAFRDGLEVETERRVHGSDETAIFKLQQDESDGTRRLFELAGMIALELELGALCVIDELDLRLHPALTRKLVELFHSPETNPKNAQLVFTAHDTNLLDPDLFRRDQVWFTEKHSDGATELYSLAEVRGVREAEAWEKAYLGGRYGAVPVLNRFLDAMKPDAAS